MEVAKWGLTQVAKRREQSRPMLGALMRTVSQVEHCTTPREWIVLTFADKAPAVCSAQPLQPSKVALGVSCLFMFPLWALVSPSVLWPLPLPSLGLETWAVPSRPGRALPLPEAPRTPGLVVARLCQVLQTKPLEPLDPTSVYF